MQNQIWEPLPGLHREKVCTTIIIWSQNWINSNTYNFIWLGVKNFPKDVAKQQTKMTAQRNKNVAQFMKISVPESLKENAKI